MDTGPLVNLWPLRYITCRLVDLVILSPGVPEAAIGMSGLLLDGPPVPGNQGAWATGPRPCRYFRVGECLRGDKCTWLHKPCHNGGMCQDRSCRLGHPVDWRCQGCERCVNGWTGAGVLLLTKAHARNTPLSEYDLVLVEEGHEYGDMGGQVDGEADVASVAARELLEETAGTVTIASEVVAQAPSVECGIFHRYIAYVVMLGSVSCTAYYDARKKPGLPRCWRETTAMQRFPLEPVRTEFLERRGNLSDFIKSHSGREYKLTGRCRSVLVEALKLGILDPYLRPVDAATANSPSSTAEHAAQEAGNGDVQAKSEAVARGSEGGTIVSR